MEEFLGAMNANYECDVADEKSFQIGLQITL